MTVHGTAEKRPIDTHITIVGALHVAIGLLALIPLAFAVYALVALEVMLLGGDGLSGTALRIALLGLIAVFAVPGLIGGLGLLMKKPWARVLVLVVSFLGLLHIPIGTAIGGYSIWVLFRTDAREALSD